jgi:hypothetical protein
VNIQNVLALRDSAGIPGQFGLDRSGHFGTR